MFPTNSSSAVKSVGIAFAILLIAVAAVFTLQATTKTGPSQDIRSHAANPADTVVDSDAVLDSQKQAFDAMDTDPELNTDTTNPADEADMKEVNAL